MRYFSNRRKTAVAALFALVAVSQIAATTRWIVRGASREPRILAECPIQWWNSGATVPITVFGQTHKFLVDTGFTVSVLDSQFKEELGLPFDIRLKCNTNYSTSRRLKTYRTPELAMGEFRLPATFLIPVCDLSSLRNEHRTVCEGIIGLDVLRTHVVQIDVDGDQFRLLDRVPDESGVSMPLLHDKKATFVTVDIPGLGQKSFEIDTGHIGGSDMSLDEKSFDALVANQKIRRLKRETSLCLTGEVEHACGVIDRIELGDFVYKNVTVGRASACVLGSKILFGRYNVTFDFPGGRLFLKPRASGQVETVRTSSLSSWRKPEKWRPVAFLTAGGGCLTLGFAVYIKLPRLRRKWRRNLTS